MAREYFCAYHSYLKAIETLTDVERGRLFAALLEYSMSGVAQELRGSERHVFPLMREQIDRDNRNYDAKCDTNRKNGSLGGKRTVANGSERYPNAANAPQDKGKDKGKDKDKKEKGTGASSKKFIPPTLEEIAAYCRERRNNVDPKRFFDYFDTSGWVDSKGNPVKNWKQKIITWEGNLSGKNQHNTSTAAAGSPDRNRPRYGYVAGTNVEVGVPEPESADAE